MPQSVQHDRQTPVINLGPALARLGDDELLLHDLAAFYLEDAPSLLEEIQKGIASNDGELVTRSAHSLKGLSANFDAHRAVATSLEMENNGRRENWNAASQHLPELTTEVELVIETLRRDVLKQ